MASLEETAAAFEQHMKDNWTSTPVRYDNLKVRNNSTGPWIRFVVDPLLRTNMAMGTRVQLNGIVVAQIMYPLDLGSRGAYDLADQVGALFENNTFLSGRIFTYACDVTRGGDDGLGWFVVVAKIPFQST